MSLVTDIIFVKALRSDQELMGLLAVNDVYNTAITLPDEEADNAPVPYVIVTFDGLNNDTTTKDSSYEGDEDVVHIGIEIAAKTRPQLADIAQRVRRCICDYFSNIESSEEDYELVPWDMTFSAEPVQYDSIKPCYWQILKYQCSTNI